MNLIPRKTMVKSLFKHLQSLENGQLTLTTPEGEVHVFKGKHDGPIADIALHDWGVLEQVVSRGDVGLGETYADGRWSTDNLEAVMQLFLFNMEQFDDYAHGSALQRFAFWVHNALIRRNSKRNSVSNIKAHYDVGNDFYRLWLDETMTYSSAIWNGANSLKAAQGNKYQRILDRLGQRREILEIGCGWGGFAEQAAEQQRCVTGVTISEAQHAFATQRLNGKADIRLQDYRDIKGQFEALVSIEMFEAVGERYWGGYFATLRDRLKPNGRAMVQTITIRDELFDAYRSRGDYIREYTFPGGMLPSIERFQQEAGKAGLHCSNIYHFGKDYARTLRAWLASFEERLQDIRAMGYGESFIRSWRFYMCLCIAAFDAERTNVAQVELRHVA